MSIASIQYFHAAYAGPETTLEAFVDSPAAVRLEGPRDVRFTPESGHYSAVAFGPLFSAM
jgi:hypothetical protein